MVCNHSCPEHCPPEPPEPPKAMRNVYVIQGITDRAALMAKTPLPFVMHEHPYGKDCVNACVTCE